MDIFENIFYLLQESIGISLAVGTFSFLDTLPPFGFFMPVALTFLTLGFLSAQGLFSITSIIIPAVIGAILGDIVMYYCGRIMGDRTDIWHGKKYRDAKEYTRTFVAHYGWIAIVLARYIHIVRPIAPFIAGVVRMKTFKFQSANVFGAFLWIGGYFFPGWIFGRLNVPFEIWFGKVLLAISFVGICLLIYFVMRGVFLYYQLERYKKLIIFDFDGTLVDNYSILKETYRILIQRWGKISDFDKEWEEMRRSTSISFLKKYGISMWKIPLLVRHGRYLLSKTYNDAHPPLGMKEVCMKLHIQGYTLGIVSSNSKKTIQKFLKKNNMSELFNFIYSAGLLNKESLLRKCAHKKNVYYVGDEWHDAESARKAHIPFLGVNWGVAPFGETIQNFPVARYPEDLIIFINQVTIPS